MGKAYIEGGGGGGVTSSDVTATKANILAGTYDIAADSADEVVEGTMPNNGAVSQTLPINGSYTIPAGYHNGSGTVSQSITTKAAATYYATTSDQTISSGQYLSGAQTIKKLTQTNLTGANIKPGVTISINNGSTNVFSVAGTMSAQAATTYYPTTSDQTIAAGKYLSGAQTIKAVSQQNLTAANIKKGVTVYIKNGSGNIYAVTGTWEGYVANPQDLYNRGAYGTYGTLVHNETSDSVSFDTGQITFNAPNLTKKTVSLGLVTPVTINMGQYTRLSIEGTLSMGASGVSTNTSQANLYVDLLNSIPTGNDIINPDYSGVHLRLHNKQEISSGFTWANPVLTWSQNNVTKYLRVLFQIKTSSSFIVLNGSWLKLSLS